MNNSDNITTLNYDIEAYELIKKSSINTKFKDTNYLNEVYTFNYIKDIFNNINKVCNNYNELINEVKKYSDNITDVFESTSDFELLNIDFLE